MAYIEKRKLPNGRFSYRARIRIQGMPDQSASFPTRSLAKEWAQRTEAEKRASRHFPHNEGKRRTFAQFVDLYIEKDLIKNLKAYSKQTQLIQWWRAKLGDYYLCHISPSMIAELRDELLAETTRRKTLRSPSTVNRYLASLSRAFNICIKEFGWLKENPVAVITRPRESKGRERYLLLDDLVFFH